MSALDLRKLWQLHEVDLTIHEIKKKAAALDPGRKIQAEIEDLTRQMQSASSESHRKNAEFKDLELQQTTLQQKLKSIGDQIYGGKVLNPREIEALEKDRESTKQRLAAIEDQLLAAMDQEPSSDSSDLVSRIEAKKKELSEYQEKVVQYKSQLEAEFKKAVSQRGPLAKEVNPVMLARYDLIRQKYGGIGMAKANKDNCGECGMHLPTKTIELAREGRIITCEACHRIVYVTDGLL